MKKVKQAQAIICNDFSVWDTVEALAIKVGLTELEFQVAFKVLHGKIVEVYALDARLQYAHAQLLQTDFPLRVICEMVGYPDPSNFSSAFLKLFGVRPGKLRAADDGK